jgi:hypothetical protein
MADIGLETTPMAGRLFLYIDILDFSSLICNKSRVEEMYNIIDQLNVFRHEPFYKCLVFSDTILVYSDFDWMAHKNTSRSIMWMCEFAQDLFYRLVGRDIHFCAILTVGDFQHSKMKNIDAFFGEALVRTYLHGKDIPCMGLFMDKTLTPHSNIFQTTPYDDTYHFVHIMQTLDDISFDDDSYPIPSDLILPKGTEYFHARDFVYLQNIFRHMTDTSLPSRIRVKYLDTWHMIRTRSATLLDAFEKGGCDPRAICDFDWSEAMRRVGTPDGYNG